jgi:AcrR family transcriptional regulator
MSNNHSEKSRMTAEERRKQIIEKAAEVFAVHGVAGTRTRDIAEACGINEALLYRHFPGKDDLYREAMLHAYDEAAAGWRELAESQPTGLLGLVAILRRQMELLGDNPVLAANMWHGVASATHDPIMKELIRDRFDENHRFLAELVKKGQRDGSISESTHPNRTAWFARGIVWIFILRTVLGQEEGPTITSAEDFCASFLEKLAPERKDLSGTRENPPTSERKK